MTPSSALVRLGSALVRQFKDTDAFKFSLCLLKTPNAAKSLKFLAATVEYRPSPRWSAAIFSISAPPFAHELEPPVSRSVMMKILKRERVLLGCPIRRSRPVGHRVRSSFREPELSRAVCPTASTRRFEASDSPVHLHDLHAGRRLSRRGRKSRRNPMTFPSMRLADNHH
jgi:hypothetical protein